MSNFDWQTDDDWDDGSITAVSDTAMQERKWRKGAVVVILLFVILAGFGVAFTQVRQSTDKAVLGVTEDVLAAHTLLQTAAFSGDFELFEIALLPTNQWREAQTDLLAHQLFWNRSALGLWLDVARFDPEDSSQIDVDFAPDLQSAQLTSVLPYVTLDADGELHLLDLQRTAVYRQVNNQWQYAPFSTDFWGERETINGRNLTIKTPARDAQLSQRLAQDLDDLIDRTCALPDFTCPAKMAVELNFGIETDSNYALNQNYQIRTIYRSDIGRVMQINMPTPTIVGLPVDEVGYQALYRGYGAQLVARIMSNLDSNCCRFGANVPSPFAVHLQTLDLHPPRPTEYHPQQALMQAPIPLPEQDIIALCQEGSVSSLFRYDPMSSAWYLEYGEENGFVSQVVSAEDDGVLISTFPSTTSQLWRLVWIVNGRATEIAQSEDGLYLITAFPFWEETSQDLVVSYVESTNNDREWEEHLIRIDLSSCVAPSGCAFERLSALPTFSPQGAHSVLRTPGVQAGMGISEYWLGDVVGEPVVNLGQMGTPTWLNEETLLLLTGEIDDEGTTLWQATIVDGQGLDESAQLLTSDELSQFLATYGIVGNFVIASVVTDDGVASDVVPIYAVQVDGDMPYHSGYLLEFDLVNGRLDWMAPFAQMPLQPDIRYSPDGRYLQTVSAEENLTHTVYLLDLETGEIQSYHSSSAWRGFDWSADGEWLIVVGGEGLSLIAPNANFERKVFYTMTSCDTAVWVNQSTSEQN